MHEIGGFGIRRRHLPHWEEPGATYFLTFCLLRPPTVDLTDPPIAQLVVDAIRYFDGRRYWLYDYTVMPDHVHLILQVIDCGGRSERLWRITHSLKSWLAHQINDLVGRTGPVWQQESYDHLIRSDLDYAEKAAYILDNARRRGLVEDPAAWPWCGHGRGHAQGDADPDGRPARDADDA